ncbi:MAG: protein kinase [Gemmatimonadetes bacterium]|nr:protein kinase [Gemmatimonadota bacterium]
MSAPTVKICPTCSTAYPSDERFCPRDGTALRAQDGGTEIIGSIIADRYHVIKKLGEGGMGRVYLAEQVKMGRMSAVKVMNRRLAQDPDAISRFNREAANASRISHQNVAAVYDFGETSEGLIYLAMEFVEGEPLTDILQRSGALPPERAAEIVRQTAEALAVAHDMGIVHRDLKPDNIMITRARDGSDLVKVVDFGIAKAMNVEAQKVTRTGLVVGTPEYMSPEQIAGDPLDGRSDIYSLGLVAFNILTGRLPFLSKTAQESVIMRLTEPPRRLAEIRPQVPWSPAVQAVMDRALQRDAALRYASASEFGRALSAAVREQPTSFPENGATEPALPVTRVSEAPQRRVPPADAPAAAAPAAAPAEITRQRWPIAASAGAIVLALLVIGAAFAFSRKPSVGTESNQAAPADQARPTPATGTPASSNGALATSAPAGGEGATDGRIAADPRATPSSSARSRSGGGTPATAGSSSEMGTDLSARIPVLLEQSRDDATTLSARREATQLLPLARGAQLVALKLVQVRSYAMRNEDARACGILRSVEQPSRGTEYETEVTRLLESCPR